MKAGACIFESTRKIEVDFEKREGELVPQGARMLRRREMKTGGPEQAFLGDLNGPPIPRVPRCSKSKPTDSWWAEPSAAR